MPINFINNLLTEKKAPEPLVVDAVNNQPTKKFTEKPFKEDPTIPSAKTVKGSSKTFKHGLISRLLRRVIPSREIFIDASGSSRGKDLLSQGKGKPASFSAYNAEPGQTDARPFEMASGKRVYDGAIATGDRSIPFGTKVYVPELDRVFTVEDRMNKRFHNISTSTGKNFFDIYTKDKKDALNFGRQQLTFVILE